MPVEQAQPIEEEEDEDAHSPTLSENWEDDEKFAEEGDQGGDVYGLKRHPVVDSDFDFVEEFEPGLYAKSIYDAFMPYQKFMHILLRYPCGSTEKDGEFDFSFTKTKPYAIGFCISSFIIAVLTFLVLINCVGILLDSPRITTKVNGRHPNNLRLEEYFLFRRNIVPVIIIVTSLIHATIGNICFFNKRRFACSYLSLWTEAAEIMRIDVACELRSFMWWTMFAYGTFLVVLILLSLIQFAPVSTGAPAILTMLTFRIFVPHIHALDSFYIIRGIFAFVFLYIMISAKSYVFLFLYYTKLLKNAFVTWNHRLELVLHGGGGSKSRAEKIALRTGYDHLFKDYICLLDLTSGVDTLFANIIESYFGTQMFSVLFEVFYCVRSLTSKNEFTSVRPLDSIIMFLYLANTFVIFFMVSTAAAEVGEEAMDGLEIMRRKGMVGKKTDEELYFMLSMYTSYSGHFDAAIMGGKYFTLDRGFIVGIAGTVLSYFVILMQFNPSLTLTMPKDLEQKINSQVLLSTAEGTRLFGNLPENITMAIIAQTKKQMQT